MADALNKAEDAAQRAEDAAANAGQGSGGAAAQKAVLYTEQSLTDEQKAQARRNIAVYSKAEVDALIPDEVDLSGYYTKAETDAAIGEATKEDEYELIETITIEEVIRVLYRYDTAGNKPALKTAWVRITTQPLSQSTTGYVYFYGDETESLSYRIGGAYVSGMSNTGERTSNTLIVPKYGRWFSWTFGAAADDGNSTQIASYAKLNGKYSIEEYPTIRHIEVRQQSAFAIGTIIEIWGVRA